MNQTRRAFLGTAFMGLVTVSGCLHKERRIIEGTPPSADVETTTAVANLEIPWDLKFDSGDAYVTERANGVLRFTEEQLTQGEEIDADQGERILGGGDLPDRVHRGEGGTLGIETHPDYPDNESIYIYYTANQDTLFNRVVRYDIEAESFITIIDGIPGDSIHDGGRMRFDEEDNLWVLTGDAASPPLSQDPSSLAGKILRVRPDGEPSPVNPDIQGGDPRVYTMGHRNPQGLDFNDEIILANEHGPQARDEVQIVENGANYGWPTARGGGVDPRYDSYLDHPEFTSPLVNTGPNTTWAPSGASFYTSDEIPEFTDIYFMAGLRSQTLLAVDINGESSGGVVFDENWMHPEYDATVYRMFDGEFGRLRHVEEGPLGELFLCTSNRDGRAGFGFPKDKDDRVIRLNA